MQEILNEIVPIIAEKLGVDPSEVTMEASFTNELYQRPGCRFTGHRRTDDGI